MTSTPFSARPCRGRSPRYAATATSWDKERIDPQRFVRVGQRADMHAQPVGRIVSRIAPSSCRGCTDLHPVDGAPFEQPST